MRSPFHAVMIPGVTVHVSNDEIRIHVNDGIRIAVQNGPKQLHFSHKKSPPEVYSVKGGFSHLQRNGWRLICGRMAAGGKGIIQAESSRANKRCDSQICYRTSDYQNGQF